MSRNGVPTTVLLRSFAIQGSWNYRTLIGTGFVFALLPVLQRRFHDDPAALDRAIRRHAGLFNSHPYLAGMALGAVARMEVESTDPALVDRFKTAVRGSLGSLGDRLVWAGWRPLCLLIALTLLAAGAPWWVAVAAFLTVYNIGHIGLRLWSFRMGVENGLRVGEKLRLSLVVPAQRLTGTIGPFLVGLLLPLAAVGGLAGDRLTAPWVIAAAVSGVVALRLGESVRLPLFGLIAILATTGLLMGWIE